MASPSSKKTSGVLVRSWIVLRETVNAYFDDKVPRLGAALAYYTMFAITPLLVLAVGVAGLMFEQQAARERILGEINRLAGADAGKAIEFLGNSGSQTNRIATAVGIATLLFGGFSVFLQLQDALNTIWRAPPQPPGPWLGTLKRRIFSLATVLGTGFLLIVSLIVSAVLNWAAQNAWSRMQIPPGLMESLNIGVSFVVMAALFAIIFKFLPDVPVRWRAAARGGIITAFLFDVGKTGLGIYFGKSNVASGYGVAGSVLLLLLWTYYTGQIVFIGAEYTRIHDITRGGRTPERLKDVDPALQSKPRS